jgi:hypothetical protein
MTRREDLRMTRREDLRMTRREELRMTSGGGAIDRGSGGSVKSGLKAEDLPESRLPEMGMQGYPKQPATANHPSKRVQE